MVIKLLTAESAADGAVLASNVSVGGDAPNVISKSGGGNLTVSTAQASHGTKSVRVVSTAAADTAIFRYNGLTALSLGAHIYVRVDAAPATDVVFFQIRNNADAVAFALIWTTGNQIIVQQRGGATKYTTTTALATGVWHRISVFASANSGATASGAVKFRTYTGDSTAPTNSYDSGATFDLGTVGLDRVQFGQVIGSGGPISFYADSFRVDDTATDVLPPETLPNTPPTANAGPDQSNVEPYTTVTLSGAASADPDGTVASYVWSQTAGPAVTLSGSGASRTFTAPGTLAGVSLTFQLTVTDNSGATGTDTVQVAVLPAAERIMIGGTWQPARIVII